MRISASNLALQRCDAFDVELEAMVICAPRVHVVAVDRLGDPEADDREVCAIGRRVDHFQSSAAGAPASLGFSRNAALR